jgi:signal transduction histidine kinase
VTLAVLWAAVVLIGSTLTWWSVRRVLTRVERLSGAASAITDPESGQRIPEAGRDDEIGRLATTLNGMLERIAAGTREIRDLSAAVAHDLRSPVTVIRGRLELALTHDSATDLQDAAASAIEGLDRVAAILEANLDVAEAEGGALQLRAEPIDLTLLCRELAELYEIAASEAGLALETELEDGVILEGDPSLLGRTLSNLLDNALRHAEGATRVRLSTRREDERWGQIAVEDDGPGFPETLRTRAFERSARRPGSPGLGLGLLLVRAVARAHGGDAKLETSTLGGAAIVLRLPLAPGT